MIANLWSIYNQSRRYHMVITMWFYTLSHVKFHDGGYSDNLYGINSTQLLQSHGNCLVLLPWSGAIWACFVVFMPHTQYFPYHNCLISSFFNLEREGWSTSTQATFVKPLHTTRWRSSSEFGTAWGAFIYSVWTIPFMSSHNSFGVCSSSPITAVEIRSSPPMWNVTMVWNVFSTSC